MKTHTNIYPAFLPWILFITIFSFDCKYKEREQEVHNYLYPLKVSENQRYLTDQNNKPFFWSGEAAWSLIAQLNRAEVDYYLDDRSQRGFTVLLVNLIEHKFADHAPANYYNEAPFSGAPFIHPNNRYFDNADYVIKAANKRGMVILLCPLYLGWKYGDEGWGQEVKNASIEDLNNWGRYVGMRYKDDKNIIWCIGGDADPSLEKEKVRAFVSGLKNADPNHLITAHNIPEQFAITPWLGEEWMNINNVYSYSTTLYEMCRTAYESLPIMPYFMIESAYENEHNASQQRLRSENYWPLLCGGMGFIAGNCPIWNFSSDSTFCQWTDWRIQLNQMGAQNVFNLQKLFRSRPWFLLQPDFDNEILTDENNTWGTEEHVIIACASDSSFLLAYIPVLKEITVDLTRISGPEVRCWWYNPITGEGMEIGIFEKIHAKRFKPYSSQDWILVIDDIESDYETPGEIMIF